jgi:hypothetical protein
MKIHKIVNVISYSKKKQEAMCIVREENKTGHLVTATRHLSLADVAALQRRQA